MRCRETVLAVVLTSLRVLVKSRTERRANADPIEGRRHSDSMPELVESSGILRNRQNPSWSCGLGPARLGGGQNVTESEVDGET